MQAWRPTDVRQMLQSVQDHIAAQRRLQAGADVEGQHSNPTDAAHFAAAVHNLIAALRPLLRKLGLSNADSKQEAEELTNLDAWVQDTVTSTVEMAVDLQWLLEQHADWYPLRRLQGWRDVLRRILLFLLATSLIEVATAMGFPPFHVLVRAVLIILHWAVAGAALVAMAFGGSSVLALIFTLAGAASCAVWILLDKDLSARANGVEALEAGQTAAAALRARCVAAEVCPRLHAQLLAIADEYAAVLQHDRRRLQEVRQHLVEWGLQPWEALRRLVQNAWLA